MTILPNEPNDLSNTNITIQPSPPENNLSGEHYIQRTFKMIGKVLYYILPVKTYLITKCLFY